MAAKLRFTDIQFCILLGTEALVPLKRQRMANVKQLECLYLQA